MADAHSPFDDLNDYVAIPRMTGLRLSPDGSWLAATVQSLSPDKKKYVTSIWRIDTAGGPPARLTRSADGEGSPAFLPDGTLLFVSKRADPDTADGDESAEKPALWRLPAHGGEASLVTSLPGGVAGVETATDSSAVVLSGQALPGDAAEDEKRRQARKDAGVSAILHETLPVRYWDHDLGPDDPRLFATEDEGKPAPRDLTPDAGRALSEQAAALSPDGTTVASGWWQWRDGVQAHSELVTIDVASGSRTVISADGPFDYGDPAFAPDGERIACVRSEHETPERPGDTTLALFPGGTDLLPGFDRWPSNPSWDPAGTVIYFTADDNGRRPVFAVDVASGDVSRLTADDAHYTNIQVAPDGTAALRAAGRDRRAARARPHRPGERGSHPAAGPGRRAQAARAGRRGDRGGRRRPPAARLAGAAGRGQRRAPRAAAAVGPRRAHVQLERLAVAVEPVAGGRPRLRGAAARPGPVHRLRV